MKIKNLILVAVSLISAHSIHSFADSAPSESPSVQIKHSLTSTNPIVNSTINGLKVDYSTSFDKFRITFVDTFKSAKVSSKYVVMVTDASGALIKELPASALGTDGKSVTRIKATLPKTTKIVATLKVRRESSQIADGALEFSLAAKN